MTSALVDGRRDESRRWDVKLDAFTRSFTDDLVLSECVSVASERHGEASGIRDYFH